MEEKVVDTVSARMRWARNRRGLSMEQVAEHLGLAGHAAIANWEQQRNYPELQHLVFVAELYGVSVDWICWGGEMSGIDAKVRKVPAVLREGLVDRLNKEIDKTIEATQRLPQAMLMEPVGDKDSRLDAWSAKNKPKEPKRKPSKTKRHQN